MKLENLWVLSLASLLLGVLPGCAAGSGSGDDDAGGDDSDGDENLEQRVVYFAGTSSVAFVNEPWPPSESELAIKKTTDPATSTMIEEVHQLDDLGYEEWTIDYVINGASFSGSFDDQYGTLGIDGQFLAGDPWDWTEWGSTSTYSNVADCTDPNFCVEQGDYLISEDSLQGTTFTAHKEYTRLSSGETILVITEQLEAMDEDAYNAQVTKMGAR